MNTRNYKIDFLKGLAAILVVLGHIIQVGDLYFDSNPVFKIIYSFHMPLFMFLSGLVSFYTFRKQRNWLYILKRFVQLIIPFLVWGFLSVSLKAILSTIKGEDFSFFDNLKEFVLVPEHGLWFLYVLFIFNFLHFLINLLILKSNNYIFKKVVFIFVCLSVLGIFVSPFPNYFGLVNIGKLLPCYFLGFCVNYFKDKGFEPFLEKLTLKNIAFFRCFAHITLCFHSINNNKEKGLFYRL